MAVFAFLGGSIFARGMPNARERLANAPHCERAAKLTANSKRHVNSPSRARLKERQRHQAMAAYEMPSRKTRNAPTLSIAWPS